VKPIHLAVAMFLAVGLLASSSAAAVPGRLVILDDARIDGPVRGDVVALGGNVVLGPHARIEGHAVAVLGQVRAAEGAVVTGQRISITSLAGLEAEGAVAARSPRLFWGVRLLTFGFWLLITSLLAMLIPGRIVRGSWMVARYPGRSLGLGVLGALTLMAALVAVFSVGPGLGLPGAVALLVLFGVAKVLGITLIGGLLGAPVLRRLAGRRLPITVEAPVGVALLLVLRMIPVAGGALWTVASVWGLGAAVVTLVADPLRRTSPLPSALDE